MNSSELCVIDNSFDVNESQLIFLLLGKMFLKISQRAERCHRLTILLLRRLPVHHGGPPRAVGVPDQQTSGRGPQPGRGRQANGAQRNPLPFQPQDGLRCSLLQGENSKSQPQFI